MVPTLDNSFEYMIKTNQFQIGSIHQMTNIIVIMQVKTMGGKEITNDIKTKQKVKLVKVS